MAFTATSIQPYCIGSDLNATERLFKGGLGPKEFPHWKETAGQVYKAGDLLQLDANGTLALCGVNGSNQINTNVAGQAITDATGTTGFQTEIFAIRPDDLFVMNVFHSTPASSVTVQTLLGLRKAVIRSSSKWFVDIENAVEGAGNSLATVKIVDFPMHNPVTREVSTIGDTNGLVIVQFVPFSLASDGASRRFVTSLGW